MKILTFEVVEDLNDLDGTPTTWVAKNNNPEYGENVWINTGFNGEFVVAIFRNIMEELFVCKSWKEARLWASRNLTK